MEFMRRLQQHKLLIILWLSLSVLLAQSSGLHMHVQHTDEVGHHGEHASQQHNSHHDQSALGFDQLQVTSQNHATSHKRGHSIGIHTTSLLSVSAAADGLLHFTQSEHPESIKEINADNIISKISSLSLLALFILFTYLIYPVVSKKLYQRRSRADICLPFAYALLPPLRAPPLV